MVHKHPSAGSLGGNSYVSHGCHRLCFCFLCVCVCVCVCEHMSARANTVLILLLPWYTYFRLWCILLQALGVEICQGFVFCFKCIHHDIVYGVLNLLSVLENVLQKFSDS